MEITIPKDALEPLLGRLEERRNWHRLEERVSKFRGKAKSLGIELTASRKHQILKVAAKKIECLDHFQGYLAAQVGPVQRGIARLISERGRNNLLSECLTRQVGELSLPHGPFRNLPGIAQLAGSIFIDPPFELNHAKTPPNSRAVDLMESEIGKEDGKSWMVIGASGVGKSTLLREVFKRIAKIPSNKHPVFIPAQTLRFHEMSIRWADIPGIFPEAGERLEAMSRDGRLLIVLDGIDENLGLFELNNPSCWAFWGIASRNQVVMSCRDRVHLEQFLFSPIERIFNGNLKTMALKSWGLEETRKLYEKISEKGRNISALISLPDQALAEKLSSFNVGGLTAWAYAVDAALDPSGRLPRNEYEALDRILKHTLQWEKGRVAVDGEVLLGLLMRIARGNFSGPKQGKTGQVPTAMVVDVLRKDYPFLADKSDSVFSALRQLPFVSYDGENGIFDIDYRVACFLAARNLARLLKNEDASGLSSAIQYPLGDLVWRRLIMRCSTLTEEEKKRFFITGRRAFEDCLRLTPRDSVQWTQQNFSRILRMIASLGLNESTEFIETMIRRQDISEFAKALCVEGLTPHNPSIVMEYVNRLKKDSRARQNHRNFYLYWIGDGELISNASKDGNLRVISKSWRDTAIWLMEQLESAERALRPLYIFTLKDMVNSHGRPQLHPDELRKISIYIGGAMKDPTGS